MFFTITEDMIKEYILGKLPEEQARVVEQQLAKDSALKAQYDELKKKEDLLRYYDSMQLKEDRISVLKKRFDASRQNPVWGRGQVWKLHDFGWFLILAVNEQYQCRGIIMNHSTHFSGSRDILFHADTIASRRLCAFTDHICTVTPDNLTRYVGELNDQTVSIISAAVSGSTPKLPEGFSFGEDIHDEEAEVWHEYISDVCTRLTNEALEAYENPSDLSQKILELTAPERSMGLLAYEEEPVMYNSVSFKISEFSLAASAGRPRIPKRTLLYKDKEIKLEASFDKSRSGVTLIITLKEDAAELKTLSLRHEGRDFLEASSIQISRKIARYIVTDPAALSRLAVLPVELIIEAGAKTYTIPLDIRKTP